MKIKPCPFCGKIPELEKEKNISGHQHFAIYCLNLDCPMDDVWVNCCPTKEKAIELWNTRTPESI